MLLGCANPRSRRTVRAFAPCILPSNSSTLGNRLPSNSPSHSLASQADVSHNVAPAQRSDPMFFMPFQSRSTFSRAIDLRVPSMHKQPTDIAESSTLAGSSMEISAHHGQSSHKKVPSLKQVARANAILCAYAYVSPGSAATNLAPFIIEAIMSADPGMHVQPLPSSRGSMIVRFLSFADREAAVASSPFKHAGGVVRLERPEDASNRSLSPQAWRTYLFILYYPFEHWFEEDIISSIKALGKVVEIDPTCLTDTDYSALRVVIENNNRLDLCGSVWLEWPDSPGANVHVRSIKSWKREHQVDQHGNPVKFFCTAGMNQLQLEGKGRTQESFPSELPH